MNRIRKLDQKLAAVLGPRDLLMSHLSTACALLSQLKRRILLLDGGMGTQIQLRNLAETDFRGARFAHHICPLGGNYDVLNLTRPDVIVAVHDAYLEAGADIITTNSFNGTLVGQKAYKLEHVVYELNLVAAQLAREAADVFTRRTFN